MLCRKIMTQLRKTKRSTRRLPQKRQPRPVNRLPQKRRPTRRPTNRLTQNRPHLTSPAYPPVSDREKLIWIAVLVEAVVLLIAAEKHVGSEAFGIELLVDLVALGILL